LACPLKTNPKAILGLVLTGGGEDDKAHTLLPGTGRQKCINQKEDIIAVKKGAWIGI